MREIFLKSCNISVSFLLIQLFVALVLTIIICLTFKTGSIKRLGGSILLAIIVGILFSGYTHINSNKIADTYKLEKSEEFFIDNKQYDNIRNCLLSDKNKINDVFKNKDNSIIEKVKINIPKEIKDYSKNGEERVIKVEVYKENTNKNYLGIDYPKEIKILKEIR